MRLADLDFAYPDDLVARHPVEPRDAARLLVVHRATGQIEHRVFRDLPAYLRPEDALVVNDTKVLPVRLFGTKDGTGAKIELLLLRALPHAGPHTWECLALPAKKLRPGTTLRFDDGTTADVVDAPERTRTLRFAFDGPPEAFLAWLDTAGHLPLPPYLRRPDGEQDRADYQTVYAAQRGAVAAPTAGLHFTDALLDQIRAAGTAVAPVTLHVGLGTFRHVEADDVTAHRMDAEAFTVSDATAALVNQRRVSGGRVVAVGTTSTRTLETVARPDGLLAPGSGWADLFIHPPYAFKTVDALVTNFHLPRTSLLLLVSAFMGYDLMREAYRVAIAERYRLFSYGDAMLIL